ncbi:RNA-binding domain-containing protein [Galbibacter sp.]|uniref:RNA-binding domain-containing protein n=1 Tax=Galbibacter sp. TaxID=2918471 RepID=UPI003A8EA39C
MTKDQLIAKLADLEWEGFEVKAAKGGLPKDTWETVSAFSNTSGGWLLFGIKQNRGRYEIQGLNNPEKIEQDILHTIRSGKFNVFVPTQQVKYNIDGKTVLAVYVPASKNKPVYYNSLQNSYIRRGSSDQRATKEETDTMSRDQTFETKTSELAPNTSKADLHTTSLNEYRDYMARFNPNVSYIRFDEDEFLTKLRIVDKGQLTYAGLLFLGERDCIEKHFPDFRIDLLEIPGTTITDTTTGYTFRLDEFENLWDYYFACFQRLKQKVDVVYQITSQGFGQEISPGLEAIRESLVNMLMHADYFTPAHSRIRIFTNHIEFYNPGGLPKPLEELKSKNLSLPRNPLISKLFRIVRLAENAGYGIDKIETNWEQYNHTAPEYDISFDSTIIKLYLQKVEAGAKTSEKPQEQAS